MLASENMIYTFEPELKEFYDFSKISYKAAYKIDELNLDEPRYDN